MSSRQSPERRVSVTQAVKSRRSVRAFLPNPVDAATLRKILNDAARAPSGTNMQPWKTHVFTGESLQKLCNVTCNAFDEQPIGNESEVRYYPEQWFEPYISRRRKVGWDLYGILGIEKGDKARMHAQHRRNFQFFDAPMGLLFTIDRRLATGSWLDYGMFLQNIMLIAREYDLDTCPQAAWADFHAPIRKLLNLPENEIIVCGLAIGYADTEAAVNQLLTERVSVDDCTEFHT